MPVGQLLHVLSLFPGQPDLCTCNPIKSACQHPAHGERLAIMGCMVHHDIRQVVDKVLDQHLAEHGSLVLRMRTATPRAFLCPPEAALAQVFIVVATRGRCSLFHSNDPERFLAPCDVIVACPQRSGR